MWHQRSPTWQHAAGHKGAGLQACESILHRAIVDVRQRHAPCAVPSCQVHPHARACPGANKALPCINACMAVVHGYRLVTAAFLKPQPTLLQLGTHCATDRMYICPVTSGACLA